MNGNDGLITVLMTVYNGKEYLSQAIESILNQSYTNFEFLIINEYGSDKDTTEILKKYELQDKRIRLIQNDTKLGFTASLNKGLALARGKYIARMDPDDVSVPKRLEIQYHFMEKCPHILMCGGNARLILNDRLTWHYWRYLKKADQIRVSTLFTCEFIHPSIMFNSALLKKANLTYNENIKTEDYELWSRCVYLYDIANVGKVLIYYRIHENNSIKIFKEAIAEATTKVQQGIFDQFNVDFKLQNRVMEGAHDIAQLEELESALYQLLNDNGAVFNNKWVFRNRMDVVYRNTEKNMNLVLNKQKRFWQKFGNLYDNERYVLKICDMVLFGIKDILWKIFI